MRRSTLILLAALVLPAGCGGEDDTAARPARPSPTASAPVDESLNALGLPRDARIKITIKDLAFQPKYIQGHPGQTLVFHNADTVAHRIKATFGTPWNSGTLAPGKTYEIKTERESEGGETGFDWICTIHPKEMYGVVIWPD